MTAKALEVQKIEQQGMTLKEHAESFTIMDQISYDRAAGFLVEIKTKIKEVEAAFDPTCKAAYDAWQAALKQKKHYLQPYMDAESVLKVNIGDYRQEQRRLADEAARKAEEDARKAEEKERKKLLKQGRVEEAELVFVPVVAPAHGVTKAEGVSTASDFDVEVLDIKRFLVWAADNMDLSSIVMIKLQPVKQFIKLTKTQNIPGIRIAEKVTVSVRGRK